MEHIALNSSQIASIAYDPSAEVMQVLFKRGGLYAHEQTTLEEFDKILNPGSEFEHSSGKAYNALIKGRKPTHKLEGTPWPSGNAPALSRTDGLPETGEPAPIPAEVQTVSRKSTELTQQATAIEVIDPSSQEKASEVLLAIASMRKEIADTFKPMKDAAFKAHRVICEQERNFDAPLADVERNIKNRIGGYVYRQQQLAQQAEEEAREAERVRAEREATERSQQQALDQAIDMESRGFPEALLQEVLANPAPVAPRYVAPAPVAPAVAQVKGVSMREDWDFRLVDINLIPREYLLVNEVAIRALGKSTKGRAKIAGVEFFPRTVVAASRRG
jgi:hypothetical protein